MDSMRSLNTSLPPKEELPSANLVNAFRNAALSVTNLYKAAATRELQARQAGYQEAVEDLIQFLDKEHLGYSIGEGRRIRQWATEKSETNVNSTGSDSDEEAEKGLRSSSPLQQRKPSPETVNLRQSLSRSASPARTESAPPIFPVNQQHQGFEDFSRNQAFTFRSPLPMPQPQDTEMQTDSSPINVPGPQFSAQTQPQINASPSLRVGVVPRTPRSSNRHNGISSRSNGRLNPSIGLGSGAGSKRKFHVPDFFDLNGWGPGKDCSGNGSKRGKYI